MLIQHHLKMSLKSSLVNKILMGVVLNGVMIAAPMTANAYGYGDSITRSVHQVKFERAALETAEGVSKIYAKLKKKAKRACAFGSNVDDDGEFISKDVCAQNLLTQFVESSDQDTLKQYHQTKVLTTKSASLLPR